MLAFLLFVFCIQFYLLFVFCSCTYTENYTEPFYTQAYKDLRNFSLFRVVDIINHSYHYHHNLSTVVTRKITNTYSS